MRNISEKCPNLELIYVLGSSSTYELETDGDLLVDDLAAGRVNYTLPLLWHP